MASVKISKWIMRNDLGGPAVQVTEETGIKVPAISPEQAVHDLAAAMVKLATDPALRARMGQAARQRLKEHFSWDRKASLMMEIYEGVCRARSRARSHAPQPEWD